MQVFCHPCKCFPSEKVFRDLWKCFVICGIALYLCQSVCLWKCFVFVEVFCDLWKCFVIVEVFCDCGISLYLC